MGFELDRDTFDEVLNNLSAEYDIYGPVLFQGKGRFSDTDLAGYGRIRSLNDMVLDQKTYFSPKEIVFPITQTIFNFVNGQYIVPDVDDRKIIIFLRPCDINGIDRIDTIFLKNGDLSDPYYKRLREKVKYFMIECTTSFENCFCVAMNANKNEDYAAAVRIGQKTLIDIKDDAFAEIFRQKGAEKEFKVEFVTENYKKVNVPEIETMPREIFEDPIWDEYATRCIACGRCNTSCVTCSCFTTQDIFYDENASAGERRRVWTGCHLDGFTDMAGGHSFRKKYSQRMRFKTLHKVYDFKKRFGKQMCVGCGRCDDVCPEYISFSSAINKLYDRLSNGGRCGE